MLAVVFALEKFNNYIYGQPVTVHSDRKPLENVSKKSIYNMCITSTTAHDDELQKYDFKVNYKQGKHMYLADDVYCQDSRELYRRQKRTKPCRSHSK